MKNLKYMIGSFLIFIMISCEKQQTDFKEFFDGHEIVYTGSVGDVVKVPGNLRTMLKWKSSTDPSIVKYVIFYNKKDSAVVNITDKTDSVSALIPNLQEFAYSFTIYSYDAKGNKSIPKVVNNVKVYGPTYNAGLLNRAYNAANPYVAYANGEVELNFNAPDTINITTKVKYTTTSNVVKEVDLAPTANVLKLTDYKPGTPITYRSSYIPERRSLDVFTVAAYSTFPQVIFYIPCDKSLFRSVSLQNDAYADFGTSMERLWDGSVGPQGYPDLFHTNEGQLPHVFTFDLGRTYTNLSQMEETGRSCCHNPLKFEIWGTNSLTNAATTLRANDSGWKAESIAKGWVLLKEVERTGDGNSPFKFDLLEGLPPVRYIRMRVITTASGSTASNISELTIWNKQ